MRANTLKNTIKALFPIQRTLCIEGAPGGGKTTIVHEAAQELGVECRELHMPTMLVEDFGILFPENGSNKLHYKLPSWFPQKGDPDTPDKGILLFDDRNQAGADLQKVLANICQARTLHGVEMPEGWMVVATGNRQEDRAGANRVLTHLRNRETVVALDSNVDDWVEWALANGVKEEVVSFIRFKPDLLHKFDPQQPQNPTPRSWVEGVSDVLGIVPKEAEYDCFCGAVGQGAATEFRGFLQVWRDLPDIDECIKNPDKAAVPSDNITRYAMAGAVAAKVTKDNFENVLKYFGRYPTEFLVLVVTIAIRKDNTLTRTKQFAAFAKDNYNIIMGVMK